MNDDKTQRLGNRDAFLEVRPTDRTVVYEIIIGNYQAPVVLAGMSPVFDDDAFHDEMRDPMPYQFVPSR